MKNLNREGSLKVFQSASILLMAICSALSKFIDFSFFKGIWCTLQVFLLWLAADFITGVIHWWEDTYGNPHWKVLGKHVVEPNLIHHKQPTKMLEGSYWNRINTSVFAAAVLGAIFWFAGLHAWQTFVCLLFCTQGNEIHAMSHRPDKRNGKVVLWLQKIGIFQSKKAHRWHHKAPYETNFCIMSDFMNPILNKLQFWRRVEWLILKLFKIKVLRGSSVRGGL